MPRLAKILLLLLAVFLAAATLAPALWMVSASFMAAGEASTFPPRLLPARPTLEHYVALFTRLQLLRYFVNSLILSVSITLISLFLNSMAGYAFAKYRFPGRDRLFRLLVAEMVIPAQVTTLPLFLMLNKIGLINTYFGVMVAGMATIYGIFLIRQFALAIPDSFLEAARMDGAGDFRIYWSVILPLCKPILITLAIFTFMGTWNDFLWPLIVLTDDAMYTLPVALANLTGEHVQDTELMMAGAVVTVLPVMIIFVALQKYYLSGIMAAGLKE
ncbi:MAG: carbohydrate ABC transporter permease [candidate division KSB1 bacterium]|nr:carbohydrate ABC transporter permease [candidate division KSB1 bacterium]MDZ7274305.1 carbohydrate ABC transporter permease [candidate division KSB1 bacterium]MDZ7287173.1 carbohydrate ABC transporter permease [candidate division KSB1 bacterium]MDZ7296902.1 carbohydrate ABC transporter permease [candidate division KSB1 bacterium]MDZ7347769.1 carbohydrate ABC transporter permease [candidate division KSB1 bacterium]